MRYLNGVRVSEEEFRRVACHSYDCDRVATHYVVEHGTHVLSAYCREHGECFVDRQPKIFTRLLNKRHFDSRCYFVQRQKAPR